MSNPIVCIFLLSQKISIQEIFTPLVGMTIKYAISNLHFPYHIVLKY